jgi:hypothetical protein
MKEAYNQAMKAAGDSPVAFLRGCLPGAFFFLYVAPYAVSARNTSAICYDTQNKIKNTEEKARLLKHCYLN